MVKKALEILTDDPDRIKPFISEVWPSFGGGAFGFAAMTFINKATRRPLFSGIQYHFLATAIGFFVGKTIDDWRNQYMADRDAVLRYYVETHPEDFPDPERKKFGELLLPWVPIR